MAHQRLGEYATASGSAMCMAVRAGDQIFIGGLAGSAPGDPAAQAEQAMRNVQRLLEQAGGGLQHIRKLTTYLTDRAWEDEAQAVVARHLGGSAPARIVVLVAGLASPEALVQIDVDAVLS